MSIATTRFFTFIILTCGVCLLSCKKDRPAIGSNNIQATITYKNGTSTQIDESGYHVHITTSSWGMPVIPLAATTTTDNSEHFSVTEGYAYPRCYYRLGTRQYESSIDLPYNFILTHSNGDYRAASFDFYCIDSTTAVFDTVRIQGSFKGYLP